MFMSYTSHDFNCDLVFPSYPPRILLYINNTNNPYYLVRIAGRKKISIRRNLMLRIHHFIILKNPEIGSRITSKKIISILIWDEYSHKMVRERLTIVTLLHFPPLFVYWELADCITSEFKPINCFTLIWLSFFVKLVQFLFIFLDFWFFLDLWIFSYIYLLRILICGLSNVLILILNLMLILLIIVDRKIVKCRTSFQKGIVVLVI